MSENSLFTPKLVFYLGAPYLLRIFVFVFGNRDLEILRVTVTLAIFSHILFLSLQGRLQRWPALSNKLL